MTARTVRKSDPLRAVALANAGGKCQAARRVQFGATDLHGPPDAAIIERCGAPVENVYHQEDNVGIIALCHDCRLKVLGLTSGERRKRTIANKNSQLALLVRAKEKP